MMIMSAVSGGFQPTLINYQTPGSYTETIPPGATTMVVEVWGATGAGGSGSTVIVSNEPIDRLGGGGGSGGYARSSYNVAPHAGKTMSVVVGTGGPSYSDSGTASSVTGGTFTMTTMTGNGGSGGATSLSGGAGGAATGGNQANQTGNTGADGGGSGTGLGGAGIVGVNGSGFNGGDGGEGDAHFNWSAGKQGRVLFKYV